MKLFLFFFILCISLISFADNDGPCNGLLSLQNRPTKANSPCVVPFKNFLIEGGYRLNKLVTPGTQQSFPELLLRVGLPADTEVSVLLPNDIVQTDPSQSGFEATVVGAKHAFAYTKNWIVSAESLFILPSGSDEFGSAKLGAILNGIYSYEFSSKFDLVISLGASTETTSSNEGGRRFNSFNPDVAGYYPLTDNFQIFSEIYGQTKTGPDQGSGFNADAGVIYLLLKNFSIDFELGQRIYGELDNFKHYVGSGFVVMF